jgi:tetratricopeptide (TPR) repeat protein
MGKKQAGKGQHILFLLAGFVSILIGFSGCMEKDSSYLAKKRIESALETKGERSLAYARNFMAWGLYKESLERSESVLRQYPRSLGDQALLNIGLVYANPAYEQADVRKSIKYFQRLTKEYPQSILKIEAEIWILVLQDRMLKNQAINELTDKIDALKKANKGKKDKFKKMQLKMIELQDQVKGLKNQINRLKSVDIRIEEKKRKNGSE